MANLKYWDTVTSSWKIVAAGSDLTSYLTISSAASTYQPLDSELTAIAGLTSAADRLPYFTGSGTAALATFTTFGRSLVDDADASTARTTLGLGTMAVETASNYLTTSSASSTYAALSGATFTGAVSGTSLTLSGDLTVNGTTTTINSTTLTVDDKNIELGSVASPTNTTADGGGITLKGDTDKTFSWVNSTSAWTSSEHISLGTGKNLLLNGSTSGTITITPTAISGTNTITIPAETGTIYVSSGTDVALADGGTNASLTASNGGIVYSTASAMAILGGTGVSSKVLLSGASSAPMWSFATYPSTASPAGRILRANSGLNWAISTSSFADTYAVNTILYAGTADTVTGLATANSSVLVTSATGVPSLSTTLPAVTLTTPTIDTINTSLTTTGTAALFNTGITTGTISIGGALTTGTINIGSGTAGAKTINVGTSTGSITLNGTVNATAINGTTIPSSKTLVVTSDIGSSVQAYDTELTALAGLTSAADTLPYFTGSGTASTTTLTTFGRSLIDDADAATARTTLGLGTMATATAASYALLASPTLTGTPLSTTAAVDTNTTQIATTAYVVGQGYAKLASPTFTGTPTIPTGTIATTQTAGNSTTAVATTAFVTTADNLKANLASPTFTGTPLAPTAASGTDTTQLATTAFVQSAVKTIPIIAAKTGTYVLAIGDEGDLIECNGTFNINIPTDTVAFPIGTQITLLNIGTGVITIGEDVPATTTLNGTPGLKLRAQWSSATLIKRAANSWVVVGDLTA